MVNFKVNDLKKMNESLREFAEYLRSQSVAEEDIFASRLVSCELISNVIIHSGKTAEFCGELSGGGITVTVTAGDFKDVELNPSLPSVFAESGRGMYIVNCICGGDMVRLSNGLKVFIKSCKKEERN